MKTIEQTKMRELPILKHFDETSLVSVTDKMSFRKGEKPVYNLLRLALIATIGYFTWVYVLPPVFQMLGQLAATLGTIFFVGLFIWMLPVLFKIVRRITRFIHKLAIKHDPFGEIEEQKEKMIRNKKKFLISKGNIINLRSEMEIAAQEAEEIAKALTERVTNLSKKALKIQARLDEMDKQLGPKAKGTDEYINLSTELLRVVSEGNRKGSELKQQKDFIQKYGARAAIMKKFGHKLTLVEASMDVKILDFEATIEILKRDYAFAQKARQATDSAKAAMLFTKGWELDYALDVVTSTIAQDIAITAGNLKDIDTLTSAYSIDQDELYNNLNALADRINTGIEVIPQAKAYNAVDYQPTHEDRIKSGGFGELY